jgi:hypothetical protein|nr:MAG TPA: lysozyme family protein [Caudoviricetes sp.]
MTKIKLAEFTDYLLNEAENGSIYVWGAQGESSISESWIRKRETSRANANRAIKLWKKHLSMGYDNMRAFDCSGLGMYYLQKNGVYSHDMTANDMMGECTAISRKELKTGDWVFRVYKSGANKGRAYHIGYVVSDTLIVVEAKGRDDGVVTRALNASGSGYWNAFGRPAVFKAEIEKAAKESSKNTTWSVSRVLKLVSPMMRGDDVNELQIRLNDAGYSCGAADGIFGKKTEAAVKKYQKAKGLTVDGKAGKNTVTALGGEWEG